MDLQRMWHGTRPGHERSQEHSRGGASPSGSRNPRSLGRGGCQWCNSREGRRGVGSLIHDFTILYAFMYASTKKGHAAEPIQPKSGDSFVVI